MTSTNTSDRIVHDVNHFKAHLLGDENETRRFILDKNCRTFAGLYNKLITLFPILKESPHTIFWIDQDSDRITISTDEDIDIFLYSTKKDADSVRDIYVSVTQSNKQSGSQNNVHVGVTCDQCNVEIKGIRYKCLICSDYDLCSNCEKSGCHPHHYMVRIVDPEQWGRHWNSRFYRHIKKVSKIENDHHHHRRGHYEKKCPAKDEEYSWVENFIKVMNNWGKMTEEDSQDESKNKTEDDKNKTKNCGKNYASGPECLFGKLNNIIDNSLQFLDPLGVNVAINIKDPSISRASTSKESKNVPKEENVSPQKETNVNSDNENASNIDRNDVNDKNNEVPKVIAEKVVVNDEKDSEVEKFSNEVEGWTLVQGANSQAASNAEKASAPQVNNTTYPVLPPQEKTYHPDPVINNALKSMIEMGFNNEGGWLTQLLMTKQGDVNKALDAIYSGRSN